MRTSARYAGPAAVLVAVLSASGCGGAGTSDGPDPKRTARETTEPAEPTGGTDRTAPDDSGVSGTWGTEDGEDSLVLSVHEGQAALLGATACTGTAATGADPVTFSLTCGDGSTDRTRGTVKSVDGKSLTVEWGSGTTDTFTRLEVPTEGGAPPSGIDDPPTGPEPTAE